MNWRYAIAGHDQCTDVQQVLYGVMGTGLLIEAMKLDDQYSVGARCYLRGGMCASDQHGTRT
jgi:hypothetical protein